MGEAHAWGLGHPIKGGGEHHASAMTLAHANISGCTSREEKHFVFIGCALFLLSAPILLGRGASARSRTERLILQMRPNRVLLHHFDHG